jgi:tetratricopeptide (TPR) repeat protein
MSEPIAHLRLRSKGIAGRLAAPGAAAERDKLKGDLATLYRQVEQELAELTELKADVLTLIDRWKQLPSDRPSGETAAQDTPRSMAAAPPSPDPAAPSGKPRVSAGVRMPTVGAAAATAAAPGAPADGGVQADHLGASTFIEKGWHLISSGDAPGAEAALVRALQLAPGDAHAEALLGWAQMLQQKHEEALLLFQQVLRRDPHNSLARVNIGYICLKKGVFGEAIEHLSRVIRADNDRKATLYAHFYLGLVYLEREMYQDAQSFFRRALALGPNLIEAHFELGRALWFGGDQEQARRTWREGFQANKFSPWGKRCAELLETVEGGGAPQRTG